MPHLRRDWAHPVPHVRAGTGPTSRHICAGTGARARSACSGFRLRCARLYPRAYTRVVCICACVHTVCVCACIHKYGVHMRVLRLCAFAALTPAACCLDRTPTAVTRLRALALSALRRRGCAFSERSPVHTAWHHAPKPRSCRLWMQQRIRAVLVRRNVRLACSARSSSAWHGLPRSPT